ncbi:MULTISPECIES: alkaline phosphatase family protein [unclassified Paenibacillus]|uniref:alkaline phosphatase family protein n=1 Tax=unclassified Paenibacillus TaxID=185978 RepID=UPI001C11A01C|nr:MULTISPECIES: alkaline phosphatase family protein [unclassified Paenibacillus]MBU5441104.1 alkaline phosphatase family protein [Paenibacillus sp. MSJ-34]CAH0119754.1 hypothetical protein PAE9249_02262 [Paenibacillus sp. CECT 9249]
MANKVVIIGIDGAGNFIKDAEVPHMHALLRKGAYTYGAQTVFPSISAECWGSLLYGVDPGKHGLNNEKANGQAVPCDFPYASIFKLARMQWPDAKLAAFSCWEPINAGIIEQSSGVHCVSMPDPELAEAIVSYIRENPDFTLMFIQFDLPDAAGHLHGFGTPEQIRQIESTDRYVHMIEEALRDGGLLEETLLILVSDHGGGGAILKDHGSDHPMDMTITWGVAGPGVNPGVIGTPVNIMDTAAVAAHALGLPAQGCWEGKVPAGIFKA